MMNPIIDQGSQGDPIKRQLTTQITTVREVSMTDLCAAEAYLVVAIPKLLNAAIEQMLIIVSTIIIGLSAIC